MSKQFLAFVVLIFIATPDISQAGLIARIAGRCAALLEKPFLALVEERQNTVLFLHDKDRGNLPVTLSLGKRLGAGFFGSVARVDFIDSISESFDIETALRTSNGRKFEGQLVAKLPHIFKHIGFGRANPIFNHESKKEIRNYRHLLSNLSKIEANSKHPKNPAWKKGHMPVAPIVASLNTERGLILLKPALEGKSLREIAKEAHARGDKDLPQEIKQALRDIYDFAQAIHDEVKPLKASYFPGAATGYASDLRSPNLLYITKPELLKALGYKRPGFILFELSQVAKNQPQYIAGQGLSFDEYIGEIFDDAGTNAD